MKKAAELVQVYEELAERFSTLAEPRRRDHCLVLAADAALAAGRPEEAERLRQRLLRVNPYHLLSPFVSMSEALESGDVRDYLDDLRHQLPPETIEQLLQSAPGQPGPVYKLVHEPAPPPPSEWEAAPRPPVPPPPPPRKPAVVAMPPAPTRQTASPVADLPPRRAGDPALRVGRWAATGLFLFGLVLAAGLFFLAFIRPLFE